MKIYDYDYHLPEKLIAHHPLEKRDSSRLLVFDRKSKQIEHRNFRDIVDYLNKDDVLVLNNTKVLPARLIGFKKDTKAKIEILLLEDKGAKKWHCLVKNIKRINIGSVIVFEDGVLEAKVVSKEIDGLAMLEFIYKGEFLTILEKIGIMPTPPYIKEVLKDKDTYQTIYAKELGSVAAPTAGLHFTKELLKAIEDKGVKVLYITLHVGIGTFRPVAALDVKDHVMHRENYYMDKKTAQALNEAKKENKKIVAVGTTTVRTLETIYTKYKTFKSISSSTDIFIYPGYKFKAVDKMITNFHLPKSTLMLLIAAFATKEDILKVYEEAIKEEYRFYSFGDAMFIL